MGLEQLELETGMNKVEVAIALLQAWEPSLAYLKHSPEQLELFVGVA